MIGLPQNGIATVRVPASQDGEIMLYHVPVVHIEPIPQGGIADALAEVTWIHPTIQGFIHPLWIPYAPGVGADDEICESNARNHCEQLDILKKQVSVEMHNAVNAEPDSVLPPSPPPTDRYQEAMQMKKRADEEAGSQRRGSVEIISGYYKRADGTYPKGKSPESLAPRTAEWERNEVKGMPMSDKSRGKWTKIFWKALKQHFDKKDSHPKNGSGVVDLDTGTEIVGATSNMTDTYDVHDDDDAMLHQAIAMSYNSATNPILVCSDGSSVAGPSGLPPGGTHDDKDDDDAMLQKAISMSCYDTPPPAPSGSDRASLVQVVRLQAGPTRTELARLREEAEQAAERAAKAAEKKAEQEAELLSASARAAALMAAVAVSSKAEKTEKKKAKRAARELEKAECQAKFRRIQEEEEEEEEDE